MSNIRIAAVNEPDAYARAIAQVVDDEAPEAAVSRATAVRGLLPAT